jgi:hypothetical protein
MNKNGGTLETTFTLYGKCQHGRHNRCAGGQCACPQCYGLSFAWLTRIVRKMLPVAAATLALAGLAGCGAAQASQQSPAQQPAVRLTSTCVTGYENENTYSFTTSYVQADDSMFWGDQPYTAYQITLTNSSDVTANVAGIAVAFYVNGAETGSDSENVTGFITPGQSLTWWFTADSDSSILVNAQTCELVQWSAGN